MYKKLSCIPPMHREAVHVGDNTHDTNVAMLKCSLNPSGKEA